jgi:hypothetical protein
MWVQTTSLEHIGVEDLKTSKSAYFHYMHIILVAWNLSRIPHAIKMVEELMSNKIYPWDMDMEGGVLYTKALMLELEGLTRDQDSFNGWKFYMHQIDNLSLVLCG